MSHSRQTVIASIRVSHTHLKMRSSLLACVRKPRQKGSHRFFHGLGLKHATRPNDKRRPHNSINATCLQEFPLALRGGWIVVFLTTARNGRLERLTLRHACTVLPLQLLDGFIGLYTTTKN